MGRTGRVANQWRAKVPSLDSPTIAQQALQAAKLGGAMRTKAQTLVVVGQPALATTVGREGQTQVGRWLGITLRAATFLPALATAVGLHLVGEQLAQSLVLRLGTLVRLVAHSCYGESLGKSQVVNVDIDCAVNGTLDCCAMCQAL